MSEIGYVQHFVREANDALARGRRPSLFVHLGYWEASEAPAGDRALAAGQVRLDEEVRTLAALEDRSSIADVGCGLGGTVDAMNRTLRGCSLVGVNIDRSQLDVARRAVRAANGNSIEWVVADACRLPLETGSLDRIVALECAFHFPDRASFVDECARTLRRGGRLVVTDFEPGAAPDFEAVHMANSIDEALGPWPDPFCARGDIATAARAAGLSEHVRRDITPNVLPGYPLMLAGRGIAEVLSDPRADPLSRAVAGLGALLASGRLRMILSAFDAAR